ncbi:MULTISPECIES: hypothetical protein [Chitinophagaceae]
MKYYVKNRKEAIRAKNHESFVTKLRRTDRQQWTTNAEYMEAYAQRRFVFDKLDILYGSEKEFVQSLLQNGLVKIIRRRTCLQSLFIAKR